MASTAPPRLGGIASAGLATKGGYIHKLLAMVPVDIAIDRSRYRESKLDVDRESCTRSRELLAHEQSLGLNLPASSMLLLAAAGINSKPDDRGTVVIHS